MKVIVYGEQIDKIINVNIVKSNDSITFNFIIVNDARDVDYGLPFLNILDIDDTSTIKELITSSNYPNILIRDFNLEVKINNTIKQINIKVLANAINDEEFDKEFIVKLTKHSKLYKCMDSEKHHVVYKLIFDEQDNDESKRVLFDSNFYLINKE